MKRYVLIFLLVASAHSVQAQFQDNIPEAKPIPPNAASMFKVLDKPLGTYTGTIPVTFPLCKVTSGPLAANVALNYTSTGGIRVEELASCVGLGFNLSDGAGRITQQVRGSWPDDYPVGFLNHPFVTPSSFDCSNRGYLYEYSQQQLDLEPDIYFYSFNGRSGKFTFRQDGSVQLFQNDGIQISYTLTGSGITGWTIIDEKGNHYYYGTHLVNMSSYSGSTGSTSGSVSSQSWYLNSETDMNDENSISFSYVQTGNVFSTYSGGFMPLTLQSLSCQGFNTGFESGAEVTTDGTEYMVDSIKGNSGYVVFNSTPQYSLGPQQLNSIQIYDSSGNLKDQYHFNYGTSFSSLRLCLNSFSEVGASGTDSLNHAFTYTSNSLPDIFSPDVDLWGFYNAAGNASGIIPDLYYTNGAGWNFVWDFWSNRMANGNAQADLLSRITYPTGGYRQFTYEGNTVLASGDFFQYSPDPAYMTTRTFNQTSFLNAGPSYPSMQQLFTVSGYFGVSKLYYTLNDIGVSCGTYTVNIMRLTDSTDLTGGAQWMSFSNDPADNVVLPNGYYRVDVYVNDAGCTMGGVSGSWNICTLDTATANTPYGIFSKYPHNAGGVRVQQIQDYDPVTGNTYTRSYKYKMYSTDSTLTSGLLASPADMLSVENDWTCGCQYYKVSPGSSYPLSMDGGSYVVYPEVRTIDSAKGWTDELFSYEQDIPPSSFPAEPPVDMSFGRGHLLTQNTYQQNGTLLKKTVNSWAYGSNTSQLAIRVKPYWYITVQGDYTVYQYWTEFAPTPGNCNNMWLDCEPDMGDCTSYYVGLEPFAIWESIDSLYSPAGAQVNRTDYRYYVNNGSFFLQKKIAYVNNSRTKEETYKYAFNPNSYFSFGLSAAEQSMKTTLLNDNYLQPLEIVDSIRSVSGSTTFLGGSKYLFGTFNGSNIHLSQFRTFTSSVDSTLLNFTTYDSRGNLNEQYKTGDLGIDYLWGYHGAYVVAKVVGSNYSTISSFVNLSVLNNPSSTAALQSQLNNLRSGLAGSAAQVTTYTYSPGYGMTSQTDPAGLTIYYDYDAFGRLQDVRDQYNNIIKRYSYKLNN